MNGLDQSNHVSEPHRLAGAGFPLTPALSLGEREKCSTPAVWFTGDPQFETVPSRVPSPWGEGQGERVIEVRVRVPSPQVQSSAITELADMTLDDPFEQKKPART